MGLYDEISKDVRFHEGVKSCMNCGVCTAICPAAEFYDYDPRMIITTIQSKDENRIEDLLRSDTIWACGQCMSCKTRCPRGNCPGQLISVLRKVAQEKGFFVDSEMGRQQYAVLKTVGENILNYGYCVHPSTVNPELHPEQGPVWEWIYQNMEKVYERLGAHLDQAGPGTLRKMSEETMNELKKIFDETGGTSFMKKIEDYSRVKAQEMKIGFRGDKNDDYFMFVYSRKKKNNRENQP